VPKNTEKCLRSAVADSRASIEFEYANHIVVALLNLTLPCCLNLLVPVHVLPPKLFIFEGKGCVIFL
jgi:hypothetical protein